MPIYSEESKLSDIILDDPSVIQVFNRFNIFLGVGDATIESACRHLGLDVSLLLAIVNTYFNRNYFPEALSGKFNLRILLDYLIKTDEYYRDILLPNIERHFNLLISKSDGMEQSSNLHLLKKFFIEVKEEMLGVITTDLENWFPALKANIESFASIEEMEKMAGVFSSRVLEEKISDLMMFFVIHLKGNYDRNLCVAVVSALSTLEKDIQQNNRIRNRILLPLCQR